MTDNMEKLLKQEEANWEDIDNERETFIFEGRRITLRDLKVILEATVLVNFLDNNRHAPRMIKERKQLGRGKYKLPNGTYNSLRHVSRSQRLTSLSIN